MKMALPKLDRDAYREQLRREFEKTLQAVADAVDNAPQGQIIRQSEEQAREALDRFRQIAYEQAIQMKVNAAEAAFPPSAQRDDGETKTA
jgi:4-alpha-glucanotransferase